MIITLQTLEQVLGNLHTHLHMCLQTLVHFSRLAHPPLGQVQALQKRGLPDLRNSPTWEFRIRSRSIATPGMVPWAGILSGYKISCHWPPLGGAVPYPGTAAPPISRYRTPVGPVRSRGRDGAALPDPGRAGPFQGSRRSGATGPR